jgi:hypothetical protein
VLTHGPVLCEFSERVLGNMVRRLRPKRP